MCQLLFLWNQGEHYNKELIHSFLLKTNELDTDTLHNKMIKKHLDGFGFCWLENKKWNVYKKPVIYTEDSNLPKKINKIVNSKVIIGHIRNKTIGDKTINNTHPFYHKNMVFSHNGKIENFVDYKDKIIEKIDSKYKKFIKGETDSEYLFYLLLTCKDIIEERKKDKESVVLNNTIILFLDVLRELELSVLANIIFATKNTCVIMRYSIQPKNNKKTPLLLYYNNTDGMIISTQPMTTTFDSSDVSRVYSNNSTLKQSSGLHCSQESSKLLKENSMIIIEL